MGDLSVGDEVFAADGHPARVVGVFDQPSGRDCYEVSTTDGRKLVADGDHLWTIQDVRRGGWETLTTVQLLERGLARGARECAYRLPTQQAIISKPIDLPIDPYLLGVWLGDGGSRDSRLSVGRQDCDEMIDNIVAAGARIVSKKLERTAWHVYFNIEGARFGDGFMARAKALNLIKNKHIPAGYLVAGTEQRLALLQGLLDTDGCISRAGQVEFRSTRRSLAEGVLYLARSLGWRATLRVGQARVNGKDCGEKFRVFFTPNSADPIPFRLRRKAERVCEHPMAGRGRQAVSIASITPVESRDVRCIKIDREDGLFLAGRDLMVTHNTEVLIAVELAGLLLLEERLILHTAQLFQTALDAQSRLSEVLARRPDLVKFKAAGSHGNESVEILSGDNRGAKVSFMTRTKKAGLGLPVDRVILDEAMFISPQVYQALRPTLSARPNPQVWFTGSAVDQREHDGCEQFASLRHRALNSEPGKRICYGEWSVPEDWDKGSPETWAYANPAQGRRITVEYTQGEYESFSNSPGGLHGYDLMRLGIGDWPEFGEQRSDIPRANWAACGNPAAEPAGSPAVVLYRAPEGGSWCIAAAQRAGDRIHVEVGYVGSDDVDQIADRMVSVMSKWGPSVVIIGRGAADALLPRLEAVGIESITPNLTDEAQACGGFLDDVLVDDSPLSHSDQHTLNEATRRAVKSDLPSGGFVWEKTADDSYVQLMAASLARWALIKYAPKPVGQMVFHATDEQIEEWLNEPNPWRDL